MGTGCSCNWSKTKKRQNNYQNESNKFSPHSTGLFIFDRQEDRHEAQPKLRLRQNSTNDKKKQRNWLERTKRAVHHDECGHIRMNADTSRWMRAHKDECVHIMMNEGTSRWMRAHMMNAGTSGWMRAHHDECGHIRMNAGTSGWTRAHHDERGHIKMNAGTSGWTRAHQDECGHFRMNAGTSGWIYALRWIRVCT